MIVAHVMGIPVEETLVQLAPVGGALLTAIAIVGRTWLGSLQRRLRGRFVQRNRQTGQQGGAERRPLRPGW